ncbi:MAG: hypothetical protein HWN66_10885 [Candidatus Helarchaeota archaeon]|nr:hypothetical protein [Candidatus Helarchaeota archaeon]
MEDRKGALEDAKIAIEKGYLKEAAKVLDEIADLSEQKGDPEGAQNYSRYAAFIRSQNMTLTQKMKLIFKAIQEKSDDYL